MATAEEILQPNPEGHIVVGGNRHITVPSNLKRLGVQYDHNMESVTFDCPRYWDGQDMSAMAVYVNYTRSNGSGGTYSDRYPVGLPTIDENDDKIMHFDWTISRNVTEVAGPIAFLVCVMATGPDDEGNQVEIHHWNSEICEDCYISKGMKTEENSFEMYPDETTQLLERMLVVEAAELNMTSMLTKAQTAASSASSGASAASTAAAEAQATLESVLEKDADIRNNYANAVKGNVSGEIIRVDDVSPIEHDVKCWVHGKNLIPYPFEHTDRTTSGITFTDNGDGTVTANGTATGQAFFNVKAADSAITLPPGTYTFSGTPSGGTGNTYYMYIVDQDQGSIHDYGSSNTFTITQERTYRIFIFINTGVTATNMTFAPMIEKAPVYTEYEPWIDPSTVSISRTGKNLLNVDSMCNDFLTKSDNGLYTFKMGPNAGERFSKKIPVYIPAGNTLWMSASFHAFTTEAKTLYMIFTYVDGTESYPGITFEEPTRELILQKDLVAVQFYLQGYEVSGAYLTFRKLQFEIGSAPTLYEPYVECDTTTPAVDGCCTILSNSPVMTLYTSAQDITIEAEYNRDTTKMFESYVLTDEAKEEIATKVENDMAEVLASLNSYATSLINGGGS